MNRKNRVALILSGGGARAAYQVGVLRAIRELQSASQRSPAHRNPFSILCGTSAGAINAATLACYSSNFAGAVDALNDVWCNMHAGQIYRADPWGLGVSLSRWLAGVLFGLFVIVSSGANSKRRLGASKRSLLGFI